MVLLSFFWLISLQVAWCILVLWYWISFVCWSWSLSGLFHFVTLGCSVYTYFSVITSRSYIHRVLSLLVLWKFCFVCVDDVWYLNCCSCSFVMMPSGCCIRGVVVWYPCGMFLRLVILDLKIYFFRIEMWLLYWNRIKRVWLNVSLFGDSFHHWPSLTPTEIIKDYLYIIIVDSNTGWVYQECQEGDGRVVLRTRSYEEWGVGFLHVKMTSPLR